MQEMGDGEWVVRNEIVEWELVGNRNSMMSRRVDKGGASPWGMQQSTHQLFGQAAYNVLIVVLDLILCIIYVHIVGSHWIALFGRHDFYAMIPKEQAVKVAKKILMKLII